MARGKANTNKLRLAHFIGTPPAAFEVKIGGLSELFSLVSGITLLFLSTGPCWGFVILGHKI
jgi:hypothetical protein